MTGVDGHTVLALLIVIIGGGVAIWLERHR